MINTIYVLRKKSGRHADVCGLPQNVFSFVSLFQPHTLNPTVANSMVNDEREVQINTPADEYLGIGEGIEANEHTWSLRFKS